MPFHRAFLSVLIAILFVCLFQLKSVADDGMFPPAPAAKAAIDFDGRGFLIQGKRTFIASGTLHYPRVPRALWRDRLLRIKRGGFNCVETYAFWNLHEPHEGKWSFSGDNDIDAFLKLVKELGMYAIVRVGPYVCAEWDSGGYPVWLRFKPGVKVRQENAPFEAAVARWYEKIIPIVAANQIHRGGAVIMVQLENEHPLGWGKEMPNGYFRRLREKAVSLGLEVPYFFSGLHHGSDPAGSKPWDSAGRTNPWFTTEFWPGWYDLYGPLNENGYTGFVRGVWKILAYGGNGYNFYMLHGGTNFETWNDDEVSSSYDYAAAVGQTGDLRPIYYAFKQAALFARSFPEILENSENATSAYEGAATGAGLRITARKSAAGTILFLDNNTNAPIETQLKFGGAEPYPVKPITILPHDIRPVVQNYVIDEGVTLQACSARILGIARQGGTTSIIVFGTPGKGVGVDRVDTDVRPEPDTALIFHSATGASSLSPAVNHEVVISRDSTGRTGSLIHVSLQLPLASDQSPVRTVSFKANGARFRVIAVPYELAQRTWFADYNGKQYVICGPEYVGELSERNGRLSVDTEVTAQRGYTKPVFASPYETVVFTPEGGEETIMPSDQMLRDTAVRATNGDARPTERDFEPPALKEWEVRSGDAPAAPDYFAGKWLFALNPPQMGADGDTGPFAWYRASVRAAKAGDYSLGFSDAGDWITVFVNGRRAASSSIKQRFDKPLPRDVTVPLKAGENTVAVFAAHYGRNKLFNHLGPIDTIAAKGLNGPVFLSHDVGGSVPVHGWRWRPGEAADARLDHAPAHTDARSAGWADAKPGEDVFQKRRGFAWYHTVLPAAPGPHRRVHFDGVDDNATVFLNGKLLEKHRGWSEPFDVKLDAAWRDLEPNELLVLVENQDNTGGILGETTVVFNSGLDGAPIQGWREHGGLESPLSPHGWKLLADARGPGVPVFYRTEFMISPPKSSAARVILRYSTLGLSRGTVWLNGHNLGRYPEKTRAPGLYLPECWLRQGANSLVVFDEEGASPVQSHILVEAEACRLAFEIDTSVLVSP